MKVTLAKDQAVGDFRELEEVRYPEVHGFIKRVEDPPIKSLLTWNPATTSPKHTSPPRASAKWVSEMRDSYRGFFFSDDHRKLFRLKEEDTPSFDPSSLAENSKERTLNSLKVTAREIPKEESGMIDSSFNDQPQGSKPQVQSKQASLLQAPEDTGGALSVPGNPEVPTLAELPPKLSPVRRQAKSAGKRSKSVAQPDPNADSERTKRQETRIKKLHQTTRWLPNSAFTTYFGKPPFCAYGQGNTKPTVGGIMYGNYLATHNVAPQEGANNPMYQQVYDTAELYSSKRRPRSPEPPRKCKDEDRLNPEQVKELKQRSQITGKVRTKPSKPIIKPDLRKAKTFQSVHSTPDLSLREEQGRKQTRKTEVKVQESIPVRTVDVPLIRQPEPVLPQTSVPSDPPLESPKLQPVLESARSAEEPAPQNRSKQPPVTKEEVVNVLSGAQSVRVQPTPSLIPLSPPPRIDGRESYPERKLSPEDCYGCANEGLRSLQYLTTYKDMTAKVNPPSPVPVAEPFRYCKSCLSKCYSHRMYPDQVDLAPEDMMRPPRNLGEIPVQELDPKTYKCVSFRFVPAKWTQRIPAAGRLTYRSPSAYQVMFYDPLYA